MKIELKRFTTNARLSQETTAFAADVWVDGKKAGFARNDGHGGSTLVHLDATVREAVEAHGKILIPAEYKSFTEGAEWLVDQLVEAELSKRAAGTLAKRVARIDERESLTAKQRGRRVARFRHADTWRWFSFETNTDPKITADAIAAKHKTTVDELVML
jgi:hypothetical protein